MSAVAVAPVEVESDFAAWEAELAEQVQVAPAAPRFSPVWPAVAQTANSTRVRWSAL